MVAPILLAVRPLPLGCLFHSLTGYWCPLCGGTRATFAMLRGDWAAVPAWNPIAPLVLLLLLAVLLRLVYRVLRERIKDPVAALNALLSPREVLVLVSLLGVFMVLRNTPWLQPWLAAYLGPPTAPVWG